MHLAVLHQRQAENDLSDHLGHGAAVAILRLVMRHRGTDPQPRCQSWLIHLAEFRPFVLVEAALEGVTDRQPNW